MRLWLDPAAHGGARHLGRRCRRGDPGQQLPIGAGPGQGLLHRHQCHRQHRADRCRRSSRRWWSRPRAAPWCGMEDIATVDLAAQSWTSSVMMNGQHAVFIGIQATPGGQPADLGQGRARAAAGDRAQPAAVGRDAGRLRLRPSSSRPRSTRSIPRSAQAVAIVVVVIFLFLGSLRAVVIPIVTIPLSLVGAGIIMPALGFSLNLLTLLAMVLAIGLVVDDAIVVVENVYRHIEQGRTPAAGGADRRARDRRPGHLDDADPGRGLCADRLSRRRHRHAVPRVRLYAGRRGDHLGHRRGDLVADDVLAAAEPRHAARALRRRWSTAPSRVWPTGMAAASTARSTTVR